MKSKYVIIWTGIVAILGACSSEKSSNHSQHSVPEWAQGIVWYQIFPERFANGDEANNPQGNRLEVPVKNWEITPWTQQWYTRSQWEMDFHSEFGWGVTRRRYGGDLQGVIDRLDYLDSLGIGGIYFNPIFDAVSHHKYDASSFHHIDRFFGPNPEGDVKLMESENPADPTTWVWTSADLLFLELLKEAKKRNIRVIIDGVFNHTGRDFWAFRHLKEHQQNSPFKDWYDVVSFDNPDTPENEFDYKGWWGYKSLPEFAENDSNLVAPVKEHIFAITKRWMDPNGDGDASDGIDGWRLDVAEEVGMKFWRDWHAYVREINPEAFTSAEVWDDKAVHFVKPNLFTSVMNYRFFYPVDDFFITKKKNAAEFVAQQTSVLESYSEGAFLGVQNLMESHDTERIASRVVNSDRSFKEKAKSGEGFNTHKPDAESRKMQRLITAFQMLYVGSPMIYYGTEAGMWGADDPDDRKPMVWPEFSYESESIGPDGKSQTSDEVSFDRDLFAFTQSLIHFRKAHPAISKGNVKFLDSENENVIVFERNFEGQALLMIFNRSESPESFVLDSFQAKNAYFGNAVVTQANKTAIISAKSFIVLK